MIDLTQFEGHTPEPWEIFNYNDSNFDCTGHYDGYLKADIAAGSDLIYTKQHVAGESIKKLAANVRLMTAAPALLEENRMLREMLSEYAPVEDFRHGDDVYCGAITLSTDEYERLQAVVDAIRKPKGESDAE